MPFHRRIFQILATLKLILINQIDEYMCLNSYACYSNNLYNASQSLKGAFYDINALRMFLFIVILTVQSVAVKPIFSLINVISFHFCTIHPHLNFTATTIEILGKRPCKMIRF